MARLPRTRLSRPIVSVVVLGIVAGSYAEYRHLHRKRAVALATSVPVAGTHGDVLAVPPKAVPAAKPPAGVLPLYATPPEAKPAQPPLADVNPPATAARVLADAKAKVAANDLLAARKLLNDALLTGNPSDADAGAIKKQLAEVQSVLLFSAHPYAGDPLCASVKVEPGAKLSNIAKPFNVPFELLMQLNNITDAKRLRAGQFLKVIKGPFDVVVSKDKFTLDLYLGAPGGPGSTYVATYPVGLGENDSTPTGMWDIKNKVAKPAYDSTRGEGHIAYGDPKNPLGPYWMALEGIDGKAVGATSYGIHGTIDPSSIGKMASQGCIRMRNEDVTTLFNLLVENKTKVKVVD